MLQKAILPDYDRDQLSIWGSLENGTANKLAKDDKAFHDWYRFVLSFPPHLVRGYIDDFGLGRNATVLDPFCGTGTTVVEVKLNGLIAVGIEANPMAHFAGTVKLDWAVSPDSLISTAEQIIDKVEKRLKSQGVDDILHFANGNTILSSYSKVIRYFVPTLAKMSSKDSIAVNLKEVGQVRDGVVSLTQEQCVGALAFPMVGTGLVELGKLLTLVAGQVRVAHRFLPKSTTVFSITYLIYSFLFPPFPSSSSFS